MPELRIVLDKGVGMTPMLAIIYTLMAVSRPYLLSYSLYYFYCIIYMSNILILSSEVGIATCPQTARCTLLVVTL